MASILTHGKEEKKNNNKNSYKRKEKVMKEGGWGCVEKCV